MQTIFLVTTIREDIFTLEKQTKANETTKVNTRCVGWYPDIQRAMQTVLNNDGDISEIGYYKYCVIEEMPWGLYQQARETWFVWRGGCYVQVPKPDNFMKPYQTVNFGMG